MKESFRRKWRWNGIELEIVAHINPPKKENIRRLKEMQHTLLQYDLRIDGVSFENIPLIPQDLEKGNVSEVKSIQSLDKESTFDSNDLNFDTSLAHDVRRSSHKRERHDDATTESESSDASQSSSTETEVESCDQTRETYEDSTFAQTEYSEYTEDSESYNTDSFHTVDDSSTADGYSYASEKTESNMLLSNGSDSSSSEKSWTKAFSNAYKQSSMNQNDTERQVPNDSTPMLSLETYDARSEVESRHDDETFASDEFASTFTGSTARTEATSNYRADHTDTKRKCRNIEFRNDGTEQMSQSTFDEEKSVFDLALCVFKCAPCGFSLTCNSSS